MIVAMSSVLLVYLFQENKSYGSKKPFAFILWCTTKSRVGHSMCWKIFLIWEKSDIFYKNVCTGVYTYSHILYYKNIYGIKVTGNRITCSKYNIVVTSMREDTKNTATYSIWPCTWETLWYEITYILCSSDYRQSLKSIVPRKTKMGQMLYLSIALSSLFRRRYFFQN
jgi:hypothetical protein